MATKTSTNTPTFALPDGQPITADGVEADLRSRVTTCEEALEDAVWRLAAFYSAVGRHEEAAAWVERPHAGPPDLGKQAVLQTTKWQAWADGRPEDWAMEAHRVALGAVYLFPASRAIDDRYMEKALPVIHEQLAKAAVRLAWVLNGALEARTGDRATTVSESDCAHPHHNRTRQAFRVDIHPRT
jgi:hypothetical protein